MKIPHVRRALGVGALSATAVVGLGVLDASPAAAEVPRDRCGSPTNGTEWVPDRGPGFDFNEACHRHDLCYEHKPHGGGAAGRAACDGAMLSDMYWSCAARPSAPWCQDVADLYYWFVDRGGEEAFEAAHPPTPIVTVGPVEGIPLTPIVTVGPEEWLPPEGTVTVGEPETIPSGGGGGGGYGGSGGGYGGGFIGGGGTGSGGGGGTRTGTVTVGEPETVQTEAE